MPDKTEVTDSDWGIAPGGQTCHYIRNGDAVCDSVKSTKWFRPASAYAHHCPLCERVSPDA